MYPGTIFNWHDESKILTERPNTSSVDDAPLFMQVFSADKGTEDLIEVSGNEFVAMYGTPAFEKHGQSAIQAKHIIDAGGRLFAKRVVANDALLANAVLCAKVTAGDGDIKANVEWISSSIANCKTVDEVKAAAAALKTEEIFPLIVYCDNGRGVSNKAVRLTPDYATSKSIGTTFYTMTIYEGVSSIERETVSFDPDAIYNNNSYKLDPTSAIQINGTALEDMFAEYVEALANLLLIEADDLVKYDIIFGYTNRGVKIEGFNLVSTGVDLDAEIGIALAEGNNGSFGAKPCETDEWGARIADVFSGNFSDEVWDVDQHKIAVVLDANYPDVVKAAIFGFVTFRKDCVYLRDFGTGLRTYLDIKAAYDKYSWDTTVAGIHYDDQRNYFVADYYTSYQIKDPTSKKNIEVTMMYDMAEVLVDHIAKNPYAPLAGTINGFILNSAIKGTINYVPVITPKVNQKEAIDELRVNYAIFEDDRCVVQSAYSSQLPYTQLSFIGNVIGIQRVLRAVRTACPRQRYALNNGVDLSNYAKAVSDVLANFITDFAVLKFEYVEDEFIANQKIFYASIRFAFLNWAQTEIFDIYAINN